MVSIISPGERTREKIPFYSSIGVVELLIIDRSPGRSNSTGSTKPPIEKVGQSTPAPPEVLSSQTVEPFNLLPASLVHKYK